VTAAALAAALTPLWRCAFTPWLLLVLLAGGCASEPAVEVFLTGVTPLESGLLEQRARLDLRVQNAGEKALHANGLEVVLKVNDARLARGVDNRPFVVPRLGEATTSTVASASLLDVVRQLLNLPGRESFSYELEGKIHLEGRGGARRFRHGGALTREQLERLVGTGDRGPAPLRLE
jgi:hypothetical protein